MHQLSYSTGCGKKVFVVLMKNATVNNASVKYLHVTKRGVASIEMA